MRSLVFLVFGFVVPMLLGAGIVLGLQWAGRLKGHTDEKEKD